MPFQGPSVYLPSSPTGFKYGKLYLRPTFASSAPNAGAKCTTPVPSSAVTYLSQQTKKPFLLTESSGINCSYSVYSRLLPLKVSSISTSSPKTLETSDVARINLVPLLKTKE